MSNESHRNGRMPRPASSRGGVHDQVTVHPGRHGNHSVSNTRRSDEDDDTVELEREVGRLLAPLKELHPSRPPSSEVVDRALAQLRAKGYCFDDEDEAISAVPVNMVSLEAKPSPAIDYSSQSQEQLDGSRRPWLAVAASILLFAVLGLGAIIGAGLAGNGNSEDDELDVAATGTSDDTAASDADVVESPPSSSATSLPVPNGSDVGTEPNEDSIDGTTGDDTVIGPGDPDAIDGTTGDDTVIDPGDSDLQFSRTVLRNPQVGTTFALTHLTDGRLAGVGDQHIDVTLWSIDTQQPKFSYEGHGGSYVWAIDQLPDSRLISGGVGGFRVWSPDGAESELVMRDPDDEVLSVKGLADGRVATGHRSGLLRIWSLDNLNQPELEFSGHVDDGAQYLNDIEQLPSGQIISIATDGVRIWSPPPPGDATVVTNSTRLAQGPARSLAVLSDGRIAVSMDTPAAYVIRILNTTSSVFSDFSAHQSAVLGVASLDNGLVVSGDTSGDVFVWDPESPDQTPLKIPGFGTAVHGLTDISGARFAISTADGRVDVIELSR